MLKDKSSPNEISMVALICCEGILLATSSRNHLICHLDERIYCCAPHTNYDRDIILEVGGQVDYQTRDRGQKMTVVQVKELLSRKYEPAESMDLLLAGQDDEGLHIYNMGPSGGSTRVMYAVKGTQGVEDVYEYLMEHWRESMNLSQVEQLARQVLQVGENGFVDMCLIYRADHT